MFDYSTISPENVAVKRIEFAQNSAVNYAKGVLLSETAKAQICDALAGADYPVFESVREIWIGQYCSERACPVAAAQTAWHRMVKEFGIEKPKSTSKEATEREAKRAEEKARFAAMSADEIATAKSDALALAETGLKSGDLKVAKSATATVEKLESEIERRHKEANKGQLDAMDKKRKHIVELLKKATMEDLVKVEALLEAVTGQQDSGKALTAAATAPLAVAA